MYSQMDLATRKHILTHLFVTYTDVYTNNKSNSKVYYAKKYISPIKMCHVNGSMTFLDVYGDKTILPVQF